MLLRATFAAALLAGTVLTGLPVQAQTSPPIAVEHALTPLPGFADLVQRVRPAVVTITTTSREAASAQEGPQEGRPQDGRMNPFFGQGQGRTQTVHALGSGFIVTADGRIVTNNHVVKDATDIHVTLDDGRELPATVVGSDAKTDLAVLQVKSTEPLPHLALGNSDAARVGDWVVAVGNPFGLGGTVTAGILSARGRQIGQGPYDDFLQIDAPINRGNSGGPLFAQDGTVIGVNTAIFSPTGGSVGIGFAIPANLVKDVVGQLEAHGSVQRGWLGVATQNVTPAMATALHLSKPEGALVSQVEPNSPAAKAGLEPGDVITAVQAQPVQNPRDLARLIAGVHPGEATPLTVHRDGQDRTLSASISAQREADATPAAAAEHGQALGLALAPLDGRAREALNLTAGEQGVVVASIRPDSPAEEAGLRPGDLLKAIGSRTVTTPQEAASALREATKAGGAVALRVVREGQSAFVALKLPGNAG